MIPDTVIQQAKATDLLALAASVVALRRESGSESAGPCPKCGGDDRLHVKADAWFCRQCHPDFGDAIEWNQWLYGDTFSDSVQRLTGYTGDAKASRLNRAAMAGKPPVAPRPIQTITPPSEEWRQRAAVYVQACRGRLASEEGAAARAYLGGRGLWQTTWEAMHLGFDDQWHPTSGQSEPVIVMPWYRGQEVWGVRYRFIAPPDPAQKQRSAKGSVFGGGLFGGQALTGCAEDLRTLVMVEGELNAASVWQSHHEGAVDVLSVGSESAKLSDGAIDYAGKFATVIVWMDKPDVAKGMMARIPGAVAISSPNGQDANDMLRAGGLGGFLAAVRWRAAKGRTEKERLLWDMWDMIHLNGPYDEDVDHLLAGWGKEIGIDYQKRSAQ